MHPAHILGRGLPWRLEGWACRLGAHCTRHFTHYFISAGGATNYLSPTTNCTSQNPTILHPYWAGPGGSPRVLSSSPLSTTYLIFWPSYDNLERGTHCPLPS